MAVNFTKKQQETWIRRQRATFTRFSEWIVEADKPDADPMKVLEFVFGDDMNRPWFKWDHATETDLVDERFYLDNMQAKLRNRNESRLIWTVSADYKDYRAFGGDPGRNRKANPSEGEVPKNTGDVTDVVWYGGTVQIEEDLSVTYDLKPIVNTAESYMPPRRTQRSFPTIVCEFSTPTLNNSSRKQLVGGVNDQTEIGGPDTIDKWPYGPRELYLYEWGFEERQYQVEEGDPAAFVDKTYIHNRLEFWIKPNDQNSDTYNVGWSERLPAVGPVQLVDDSATMPEDRYQTIDAKTSDGQAVPSHQYALKSDGTYAGAPPVKMPYLDYNVLYEGDFNDIFGGVSNVPRHPL